MFYNIKIKSCGSEFILESRNKEITQREMDLYFSKIFDVSPEFISKINDVKVECSNLVSINEIDNHANVQLTALEDNQDVDSENTSSDENVIRKIVVDEPFVAKKVQVEHVSSLSVSNEVDENAVESVVEEKQDVKPVVTSSILIQNDPELANSDDLAFIRNIRLQKEQEQEQNTKSIVELTEEENQKRLNDIFSQQYSDLDDHIEEAVTSIQAEPLEQEQPAEQNENSICEQQNECVQSVESDEIIQPVEQVEICDNVEQEIYIQEENIQSVQQEEPQDEQNQTETEIVSLDEVQNVLNDQVSSDEIVSIKEAINSVADIQNVDFKTYLTSFNTDSLVDEFLICAYYIKNAMQQDGFTMKAINAKLFGATGKIADMSVVQELSNKEYITFVQDEISNKYFITPDGENYVKTSFQS